jgi:adenosylcobinamide-GDP ribazoletransferase
LTLTLDKKQEQSAPRHSWSGLLCRIPLDFLAAVQFLTVAPAMLRRQWTPEELGRSVGWFAVVGVLLGAALAGVDYAFGWCFPRNVGAALVLALWVLATGALHLDGFLDTCDGLFGGRTPEARLRIMRDERVGAFAVIGGILLMLTKYASLAALVNPAAALLVAPTLGRCGLAVSIVAFPYARAEGLGRCMKDHAGWRHAALATATAMVTAVLAAQWLGLAVVAAAFVTTLAGAALALRRLPGLTGDVYGALCELLETVVLLAFVAGETL